MLFVQDLRVSRVCRRTCDYVELALTLYLFPFSDDANAVQVSLLFQCTLGYWRQALEEFGLVVWGLTH